MRFTKMHGNGNDFVIIEDLKNEFLGKEENISKSLCNRRFGIGADGLLLVREGGENYDIEMVIINSDGSYAAMCGNGIRCFAKYVYDRGIVKNDKISILTGDGVKTVSIDVKDGNAETIEVNMGYPSFEPDNIPVNSNEYIIEKSIDINDKSYKITSLLMGVPHTVVIESEETPIEEGKDIENYALFPQRTNVNFCRIINDNTIRVRTWERGAGPTLGCGTGNCASAIVANKLGYVGENINVLVPGGSLKVTIEEDGIYMIGTAEFICEGVYYI